MHSVLREEDAVDGILIYLGPERKCFMMINWLSGLKKKLEGLKMNDWEVEQMVLKSVQYKAIAQWVKMSEF